ncbi:MAG: PriCT-2 domain-containing protein [Agitococcus sp.]|nr:PriCT-2 domain-containing protein [Agitococcus sp.]
MVCNSHIDIARAQSALNAISSDCDRETWVRILAAAKAAGLDFEVVHDWSAGATNYKGRKDVLSVWLGLKESGGITAGTLFHLAKSEGWREEDSHQWQQPKPTKHKGLHFCKPLIYMAPRTGLEPVT